MHELPEPVSMLFHMLDHVNKNHVVYSNILRHVLHIGNKNLFYHVFDELALLIYILMKIIYELIIYLQLNLFTMSLNELLLDQRKPWLNVRLENLVVDGYAVSISGATGLTGGSSSGISQQDHQYNLSGFTGGATLTLGSASPDGQVLVFVVGSTMAGACTIAGATTGLMNGNILGQSGASKNYSGANSVVVGTSASVGDTFQLKSVNNKWSVSGIVSLASSYT
jgi:hypothetical protein